MRPRPALRVARRVARLAAVLPLLGVACAAPGGGAVLPGGSGKEPVSIDAGKLDYFDKEQKLIYSGDVVARQGTSTLKGSMLTIFLTKQPGKDDKDESSAATAAPAAGNSIRSMDVKGPVTVISKDQVGTGDNGSYDKAGNTMTLTGHVTLTQATNVVKGDRLVYDMTTGQAQVFSGQTQGRVSSVFTPKSGAPDTPAAQPARKPKAGARAAPVKTP